MPCCGLAWHWAPVIAPRRSDGVVEVDLSAIRPMIALPMHPSNAFTIEELNANLEDILHACEEDVQKLIGRCLDLCSKIEKRQAARWTRA